MRALLTYMLGASMMHASAEQADDGQDFERGLGWMLDGLERERRSE